MTAPHNKTVVTEFLLVGLTESPELKCMLFVFFFFVYVLTVVQNGALLVLISVDGNLHTPMYSFLRHLSFIDICYSSSVSVRMMVDFFTDERSISVAGCGLQMLSFNVFGVSECFLLTAMSYDRYVAICKPLTYLQIMSRQTILLLVGISYLGGFLSGFAGIGLTFFRLDFCEERPLINHFYCDIIALIQISCSDSRLNQLILFTVVSFIEFLTLLMNLLSYLFIIVAVLRIRSSKGRRKAFSTCASHLLVVTLLYGTVMFMYLRPSSAYRLQEDKVIAIIYTIIIPFLNPLIYSLRNRDVKTSAEKVVQRMRSLAVCAT